MDRRRMLRTAARFGVALGAIPLVGCAGDGSALTGTDTTDTTGGTTTGGAANCVAKVPEETAGPYPGDGSNGPDVLAESGVVRSDITSSFGDASGVAEGVPMTVKLKVYDLNGDDATPLAGAAVYLWHCDREGSYSMYDGDASAENYLRGVQEAADDGTLQFTTIFPACYAGRWPHMHFEVYESLDAATTATNKLRTSQLALPQDVCETVYATEGYEQSVSNLAQVSLDSDGIFSDGYSLQMAKVTGSVEEGYVATLNIPV
jgi:protocatechuate 3,4-dioxygenase beta subunit